MDVLAVCMGGDEKGILALGPAHRRFIAHLVCFLRGDLSRLEGLANLIAQYIGLPALLPARGGLVLDFGKQELGVGGHVVALIGGDQFAALGLVRVLPVVQAVFERLGDGFSLADMVGNQARGGRPKCVKGYWLVNFPQCGEKDDIAEISIKEEDLEVVRILDARVNEQIKAQFEKEADQTKSFAEMPDDLSDYRI